MGIVFFEVEDLEAEILLDLYGDIDYDRVKEPLTVDNVSRYAEVEVISCFLYSDLSKPVLEKLKKLKFIATRSRSFDHIDMDYCRLNGIIVSNVPHYGEHTVAEHVFSLLLSLSRHIPQALQQVREGSFSLQDIQGFDLYGKTMGIIGTGAIGLHVAHIAKAFGMNVLAYDIRPRTEIADKAGFVYVGMDALLEKSDVVSLHVSAQPASTVLSEKQFFLMKDGVVIINTSRGSAIDAKALLRALLRGKVRAAGLDVLPDETAVRDDAEFLRETFKDRHDAEALLSSHALLRHKNVIITPHSAFYTRETVQAILETCGDNIAAFLKGASVNTVTLVQQSAGVIAAL